MAFGLCTGATASLDAPIGKLNGSFGWWTDGSLRAHGDILIPTAVRYLEFSRWNLYAKVCSVLVGVRIVFVGFVFLGGPAPPDPILTPLWRWYVLS